MTGASNRLFGVTTRSSVFLLFVALLAKWLRRRTCNAKITRSNRVQGKLFASRFEIRFIQFTDTTFRYFVSPSII